MIGGASGEMQRRRLLKGMKDELSKSLPQIAREQAEVIRQNVLKGFYLYEEQILSLMNEDIEAQREELDNLLKQKQKHEIDQRAGNTTSYISRPRCFCLGSSDRESIQRSYTWYLTCQEGDIAMS